MRKQGQFALYKGDNYLYGGTIKELAKYLNVKDKTIYFYSTKAYKERRKDSDNSYLIIKLEEE